MNLLKSINKLQIIIYINSVLHVLIQYYHLSYRSATITLPGQESFSCTDARLYKVFTKHNI